MSAGRKNNAEKKDWNTPPKYIKPITEFFGGKIELDPCSNQYSLVNAVNNYLYPENDGLMESWNFSSIFVNPPYGKSNGKTLYDWIYKGASENRKYQSEIIYLIPVATNTKHFKEIIFKKFKSICFLEDTRLKFYNEGIEDKKRCPYGVLFMLHWEQNI